MEKATLDILNKKHVKFDQGLDFLIFCQGDRGKIEETPRKNQEQIRNNYNPMNGLKNNSF